MLVRLFLLLGLIAGVTAAVRWLRQPRALGSGARAALPPGVDDTSEMREARLLATQIDEVARQHADSAEGVDAARGEVEAVLSALAQQLALRARIDAVLSETHAEAVESELAAAEARCAAATTDEAREAAGRTRDRLQAQQGHLGRLRGRRAVLDDGARQIVVELRNLHLSLLDAASSSAGIGDARLAELRRHLVDAADGLRRQAAAQEEIDRMLTRARDAAAERV